jgi:hypothetical protein
MIFSSENCTIMSLPYAFLGSFFCHHAATQAFGYGCCRQRYFLVNNHCDNLAETLKYTVSSSPDFEHWEIEQKFDWNICWSIALILLLKRYYSSILNIWHFKCRIFKDRGIAKCGRKGLCISNVTSYISI